MKGPMRRLLILGAVSTAVALGGCQWQAPMPKFDPMGVFGPRRIPPPGTGSYGRPDPYYQPSGQPPGAMVPSPGGPTITPGTVAPGPAAPGSYAPGSYAPGPAGTSSQVPPRGPVHLGSDNRLTSFEVPAERADAGANPLTNVPLARVDAALVPVAPAALPGHSAAMTTTDGRGLTWRPSARDTTSSSRPALPATSRPNLLPSHVRGTHRLMPVDSAPIGTGLAGH